MSTLRLFTIAAVGLGALAACSKDSTSPAAPANAPNNLVAISGINTQLRVGGVPDTLTVFVGGTTGEPVAGATVAWQVASGDATVSAPTSVTDASGIARIVLTSGTHVGSGTVLATAGTVAPLTIFVDELPGAPARLVAMTPAVDSISVGDSFTFPAVEVQDAYGNAVPGVTIVASEPTAIDGDALAASTLTTDSNGVVQETFVPANTAGVRSLQFATADGALSVTYTVTVVDPTSAALRAGR